MYRRMPKRGFTNVFAKETAALNVDVLAAHFAAGERVDMTTLKAKGLVKKKTEVRAHSRSRRAYHCTYVESGPCNARR